MQASGPDERVVHVWAIDLRMPVDGMADSRLLLADDEIERADRFYFENDRRRFIAARCEMRRILSAYLNVAPQHVSYAYGSNGKPELDENWPATGLRFNLSHSRDVALLAIARRDRVGVDIEFINPDFAAEEIAKRFFSPSETRRLCELPEPERPKAFFDCWTRKEAFIKALGDGLSRRLDSFDVAFGSGVRPALLRAELDTNVSSSWGIYELAVPFGYAGAVVVEGEHHRVVQANWER